MSDLLNNATAAAVPAAALAVILALLSFDAARASRTTNRRRERATLDDLVARYYRNRPTQHLYGFVGDLSLAEHSRRRRLLRRACAACTLSDLRIAEGWCLGRQWVQTVGRFAHAAAVENQVPLRRFLQTYHLGVIREGALALPFVVAMAASGQLSQDELREAAWGIALVKSAAMYNARARQQREPVYFMTPEGPVGPVVQPPRAANRWLLNIADRSSPDIRLRRWRYRLARRQVIRIARQLQAAGMVPSPH